MISAYIKELLHKHNRVIVPDLGAFLRKNENPDSIYFNEFLRFNDGLLVDYLSEKENIDKIESAKKIKTYVAEVNKSLNEKLPVDLVGIGTLFIDSNDKIQLKVELLKMFSLEQEEEINKKSEKSFEIPITNQSVEDENIKPAIKKPKKANGSHKSDVSGIKNEINSTSAKSSEVIKDEPSVTDTSLKSPNIPEDEIVVNNTSQTVQTEQLTNEKLDKDTITSWDHVNIINTKKRRKLFKEIRLMLIYLLVIVLLGLAWIFFKPQNKSKKISQNNILIPDTEIIKSSTKLNKSNQDSLLIGTSKSETSKPLVAKSKITPSKTSKPAIITKVTSERKNSQYYIVGGCFAMEGNADKFVQSLISDGYQAEKFAKIKELYYVSIASFTDKTAAYDELKKIEAKGYPSCWVMYY